VRPTAGDREKPQERQLGVVGGSTRGGTCQSLKRGCQGSKRKKAGAIEGKGLKPVMLAVASSYWGGPPEKGDQT